MERVKLLKLIDVAMKRKPVDLLFKNVKIFNVFTEKLEETSLAVCDGIIVGMGNYEALSEVDCCGKTLIPAFTDAHLHIESSMLRPYEFIEFALKSGTVNFIVDPHEVANVKGAEGIDFILSETEKLPANVYIMLPSCVPAVQGELNGCNFDSEEMKKYLNHPRILGLGEVMDVTAVTSGNKEMLDKIELFDSKLIDGHMIGLSDEMLNALAICGVSSDHESENFEEAFREYERGIFMNVREGSTARNIEHIVPYIVENKVSTDNMGFCTDDKHASTIKKEGHILFNVKKAVSMGLSPEKAVKMASYNSCRHYGLKRSGAIAPGYYADMLLVDSLESLDLNCVYYRGRSIDDFDFTANRPNNVNKTLLNTINYAPLDANSFTMKTEGQVSCIGIESGHLVTKHVRAVLPCENGVFTPNAKFAKLAVIERHKATGKVGVCAVTGFNLINCAIASSVGHDSHNIIVVGDNDKDMLSAVEAVKKANGGYSFVSGDKTLVLPLEIMGLMSMASYEEVTKKLSLLEEQAHLHGLPSNIEIFTTLSFLALPVIPSARLTPNGLLVF